MPPRSANAITWKLGAFACAAATSLGSSAANADTRTGINTVPSDFRKKGNISVNVDSPFRCSQVFRGHRRVELQVDESHHHFIPTLLSPDHTLGRVWILRVVRRIIEMRGAFDFRSLR